ncbi:MAG TPA: extracellular solute-binding protein [Steroidobacteraceae bacterium]|nr:extracellular solute-binding protein [Steroidobacteraceae bacterium]
MSVGDFPLSRRALLQALSGAGAAALLGACASPRFIDILAPPSALRPRLLRTFERNTGVQVRAGAWISPTDALGKLLSANARIDMMIALADLFLPVMPDAISRGLLLPLDAAQPPDAAQLLPQFAGDLLTSAGKTYSVPLYWGYDTVLYNRKALAPDEPLLSSWGLIFDDRFRGRVSLKDDAHESIVPTALYMGHPHPLEMDAADLREVTRFLISKKRNFRSLWTKFAEAIQLMATGEVQAMYGYPLMLHTLRAQDLDVAAALPREGLLVFVQSAFIPRSAADPAAAAQWVSFLLQPDVSSVLNQEAAVFSPAANAQPVVATGLPDYETVTRSVPLVRLGRPRHLPLWIEAWARFKAA